jgi:hypothetical protein
MKVFSKIKFVVFLHSAFLILNSSFIKACQCPFTNLSIEECNKYEIIFRGSILSAKACENNKSEAIFKINELYKGIIPATFKIIYDCGTECSQNFSVGEEWIIYTKYKHIDDGKMDWCSRSRKYFKNEKEDFYLVGSGKTYHEELVFLQKTLGTHTVLKENPNKVEGRNILPNQTELIITLLCSIAGIVLFYYLFNKFFK